MPNAYIKKLKQKSSGDTIYPESTTGAIYMPDNTTTLDGYLGNTNISGSGKSTISGVIGETDISSIGDGTITGAINTLKEVSIIEEGKSGIWTYRKWANGIAECWGTTAVASHTYAANGGYYNVEAMLPSGLFNVTPTVVIASGKINTAVNTDIGFTAPNNAASVQTYLINRQGSAVTQAGNVYWIVRGTWK